MTATVVVPEIDIAKCQACGDCVTGCPTGAVAMVSGHASVVRPELCSYCAECEALCPQGAIACPFEIVVG